MYKLVLFDLDGTLVDTAPDIADAVNALLRERGLRTVPEPWVRDRIGHGTRALLVEAWTHAARLPPQETEALVPELCDAFAERYAQCCGRRGRLFRGAATTLSTLRAAGVKLALVTNKEQRFVRFLLEVHGLDGDFDLQVCGDSLPARKPDPLPVQHCLEVLQLQPEQALYVGDSAIDVATARAAGVAIWAVSYGYNQGQPIARARPDRVIGSLSDVLAPFAERIAAAAPRQPPRASSSSLYFRSNPRN
jgi:phosphoglycolate phosphatase